MRYALLRPLIDALDPELAHRLTVRALSLGLYRPPARSDPGLERRLLGLDFPNPIGLAAGFDKNGEVPGAMLGLGFGFVEIGTVTPRPQAGNPRPRVFRLPADEAVINRLGFNNDGFDAVHARLTARRRPTRIVAGIVGVNIGANRDSADRVADYAAGITRFAGLADYIVINVSSPNTPGLRDLQERTALDELLRRVSAARAAAAPVPVLLKIAPDLDAAALSAIAEAALSVGIDGMIVSNTTVARDGLRDARNAVQFGGLSGRPLFRRSTILLARLRQLVGNRLVLIGAGGVASADTAWSKLAAGADLVQLYTGLVYQGPGLPARILRGLRQQLDQSGLATIADVVGSQTDHWAGLDAAD